MKKLLHLKITFPVDCQVTGYGPWDGCSVTCGDGTETRKRNITVQSASNGKKCPALSETRLCSKDPCPGETLFLKLSNLSAVQCEWDWTEWSDCTKTCENGTKTRSPIIYQEALHGAPSCPSTETEFCNTDVFCPGSTKVNQIPFPISYH